MKHSILIIFLSFITLTNCSTENSEYNEQQIYTTYWHLINVSGGIAGVDNDFDLNEIVWLFDENENQLIINNINTTDVEDGLDSNTYTYLINEGDNEDLFLSINSNEYGGINISENLLIIDQNITTNGTGSDGFIYTFKRVLVLEDVE